MSHYKKDDRPPLPHPNEIAEGRWDIVFQYAGLGEYMQYTKKEGPCPVCGGITRFRFLDLEGTGRHFCGSCDDLPNKVGFGLRLLMQSQGWTFAQAAKCVREALGVRIGQGPYNPVNLPPPKKPAQQASDGEVRAKYMQLWNSGFEITPEDAAGRYLARRVPGLTFFPKTLRFHPKLDYWEDRRQPGDLKPNFVKVGTYPGMLAYVQAPNGELAVIWRWFLTPDGAKADVPEPKKAAGRWLHASGALRLGEPKDGVLGTCEGMEGGLRMMVMHGIAIWPAMNAGKLERFQLPEGYEIKRLYVYGDRDEPKNFSEANPNGIRRGDQAAQRLVESMKSIRVPAFLRMPASTKYDFGDVGRAATTV